MAVPGPTYLKGTRCEWTGSKAGMGLDTYAYASEAIPPRVPPTTAKDRILDADGKGVLRYTYKAF
jgi:hypothetical protein